MGRLSTPLRPAEARRRESVPAARDGARRGPGTAPLLRGGAVTAAEDLEPRRGRRPSIDVLRSRPLATAVLVGLLVGVVAGAVVLAAQLAGTGELCLSTLECPAPPPGTQGCGPVESFCPPPQVSLRLTVPAATGTGLSAGLLVRELLRTRR